MGIESEGEGERESVRKTEKGIESVKEREST